MKHRQYATYLITLVFSALFSCANPTEPTSSQFTVVISGTVANKSLKTLDSVQIILANPNPSRRDSARANGTFSISFQSSEKNPVSASLTFSRSGFFDTTRSLSYSSTSNSFDLGYVVLRGTTAALDSAAPSRPSLRAGAIVFVGSSSSNLSIYGAGGTDAVNLTFEVRDSLGNPVDTVNQTLVRFRFANTPPDTLTQLSRTSAKTNSSGRVTVLLGSGLRAGIASVQAYAAVKRATDTTKVDTIRSGVVSIPIYGGYPDSSAFSLNVGKVNVPGAVQAGIRVPITAIVGDKYGNPAQPGTVVYFGSTGGIVFPASKATGEDGTISVDLITGNPVPGSGIARVTAQINSGGGSSIFAQTNDVVKYSRPTTRKSQLNSREEEIFRSKRSVVKFLNAIRKESQKRSGRFAVDNDVVDIVASEKKRAVAVAGDDVVGASQTGNKKSIVADRGAAGNEDANPPTAPAGTIFRSVDVIFSGATQINVPDTSLNILKGGQKSVKFTVSDPLGHPLSGGSGIRVSTTGSGLSDVELTGDVDRTIPDTKDPGFTSFTVNAKDKRTTGFTQDEDFSLSITVTSDNGNVSRKLTGKLLRSGVSDSGRVARVALVNPKVDSITVAGGGGVASQFIQFQVLDVNDKPTAGVPVQFEIVKSVGGGEYFNPTVATSDGGGNVQTTLFAGIRSGVVQVVAKARKDTVTVVSDPKTVYVRTGVIASIAIINISSNKLSVLGVGGTDKTTILVEGRDSLGNPIDASNSTSINFSFQGDTSSRISPTIAKTDPLTGRATTNFTAGTKSGVAYVTASARNDSVKSSPIQLSISGGAPDSLHFSIGPDKLNIPGAAIYGLTDKISIVAGDKYGNPAQEGSLVFFNTTGGIIQSSLATDVEGKGSVTLTSGNPIPGSGFAIITAQVGASSAAAGQIGSRRPLKDGSGVTAETAQSGAGAPSATFSRSTTVLFSGLTQFSLKNIADTNFSIPANGVKTVYYDVGDSRGNPLSEGSTIKVSVTGQASSDVELTGDVDRALQDVQNPYFTHYAVAIRDKRTADLSQTKDLILKFDIQSRNGNGTFYVGGSLLGSGVSDTNRVSAIVFVKSTNDTIVVAGAGTITSDTLTFKVHDKTKQPVKGAAVQFFFSLPLGASEYLTPAVSVSDSLGVVRTIVNSGVRAGLMKVAAKVLVGTTTISSDDVPVYVKTGPMASIALISIDNMELSVKGVGGTENALITFEPRDALGNPIDFANQTQIFFNIQGGPGSGEVVSPSSRVTDPFTGRVTTTLTSGTSATVLQVIARNAASTIKSSPVPITVHSGFADQAHFTFLAPPANLSLVKGGGVALNVIAGDKYSNPVKTGTAIYFSSTGGVVSAAGYTNDLGQASTLLQVANPVPPSGIVWVKARTVGEGGVEVSDSTSIVFSKGPLITLLGAPDTIKIFDGGLFDVSYKVADVNGNAVSAGNNISVTVSGTASSDINLSGDVTTPTTRTLYSFRASDRISGAGLHGDLLFTILVKGESAPDGVTKTIPGILFAPGDIIVPPSARQPAQIAFSTITKNDIFVAGVGATENSAITYQVLDSLGQPIAKTPRAYATFGLQFFPNTFAGGGTSPTLIPSADSTDDSGKLRVSVQSGTQAGVVQVIAQIQLGVSKTIVSQPVRITVHAGFADQTHFTLAPASFNFGGLDKAFVREKITVQVVDKYSNPVQEGTAVYFNTSHGSVQTGGLTDKDGFVANDLISGNPFPVAPNVLAGSTAGFTRVYARTIGKDSARVVDSVLILWTGAPIITMTGGPASYAIANGGSAGPYTFTVLDRLGHPMSPGTTITVTADACTVNGDANISMPDTQVGGAGLTSFTVLIKDADPLNTAPAPVPSVLTVVVTHPVYGTYKLVLASGTVL